MQLGLMNHFPAFTWVLPHIVGNDPAIWSDLGYLGYLSWEFLGQESILSILLSKKEQKKNNLEAIKKINILID